MAIKELQTRIALKYDSYANWTNDTVEGQGANLVLLPGEIGICAIENKDQGAQTAPTVLFKVGDGTTPFKSLRWASALAADVYSWAKSETVVLDGTTIKFKTGDVVNHSIDLGSFATDAEVETIRSGLDSRITTLEGKFTGDGSVQGQITALDGRLDVIEGEGEGSVKKALADAKSYADSLAGNYDAEGSAAQALVDAKAYADGKDAAIAEAKKAGTDAASALSAYKSEMTTALAGKQDVIAENTYDAYGAAAGVKSYVDGDFKTEIQGYADGKASAAETAAKGYADGIVATEKSAREAEDLRLAGLIGGNTTAINKEIEDRAAAVKEVSDKVDVEKVSTAIATAKSEAIADAKTETEKQVKALADGQVKTNKETIATLSGTVTSEIARVEGLVTAEAERATGVEEDFEERITKIETFFDGAYAENGQPLNDALDTLVEIQTYLTGDGEAAGDLIGRVAQAESDIDGIEAEFADGGRVTKAEVAIDALNAKDTELAGAIDTKLTATEFTSWKTTHENGHAKSAADITTEITTAVNGEKTLREAADNAINEKIGGSYNKDNTVAGAIEAVSTAANRADAKSIDNASRLDVVEPKVTTLQDIVNGYTAKSSIKTAIEAAQTTADNAQDAADTAQGEIDALELVVGNETTGLAATKTIADRADAKSVANAGRLDTAESNITTLQGIVSTGANSNANLRSAITDLQTLTGDNGAIRSEIAAAKKAGDDAAAAVDALSKGQVATNKTDIATISGKVTAIENDYVKASDLVGDFYVFNCGSSTEVTHVAPKN